MAKTAYEKELSKQLRRINRRIKSLETRGYVFFGDVIPEEFKSNVEQLKTVTPDYLYSHSIYSYQGETYTGEEGRRIERSLASAKGAETKARQKAEKENKVYVPRPTNTTKTIDEIRKQKQERDAEAGNKYSLSDEQAEEAKITLNNLIDKLTTYEPPETWNKWIQDKRKGQARTLLNILKSEIESKGELSVAQICQQKAIEIQSLVDGMLYGSNDKEAFRNAFASYTSEFASIIKGGVLSMKESVEMTEQAEANGYYSPEDYEG